MLIDFQKAKEKKQKGRPQGYLGFLRRKMEHERLEEFANNFNNIISTGSKELIRLNKSSRKNMKYLWLLLLFFEAIFFFNLHKVKGDPVSTGIIIFAMIFFVAVGVVAHVFLKHEYKGIIKHSQPFVFPKTDKPPYYSKN